MREHVEMGETAKRSDIRTELCRTILKEKKNLKNINPDLVQAFMLKKNSYYLYKRVIRDLEIKSDFYNNNKTKN